MTAGWIGGMQLSRQTVLQMLHAGTLERQERRQREAEAEARREQTESMLQAYYQQYGEYPNETLARQRMLEVEREAAAEVRRAQEREAEAVNPRYCPGSRMVRPGKGRRAPPTGPCRARPRLAPPSRFPSSRGRVQASAATG
jgi:DNA-binding protein H-NS